MWVRILSASFIATFLAAGCSKAEQCKGNPNALGTSRVIQVDPSKQKRVGTDQYPETLPLEDHEVVLTFDDGPLPPYTLNVLDILKSECVKATFFTVGSMAQYQPQILKREHDEGHTIGTHTQHHPHIPRLSFARAKKDIDDGIASAAEVLGGENLVAPFFRFPYLEQTSATENYAISRGLMIWSVDLYANDWTRITPDQVMELALKRLEKKGRGILLLHDIQARTAAALPEFLHELKRRGYRVVHVVPAPPSEQELEAKQGVAYKPER